MGSLFNMVSLLRGGRGGGGLLGVGALAVLAALGGSADSCDDARQTDNAASVEAEGATSVVKEVADFLFAPRKKKGEAQAEDAEETTTPGSYSGAVTVSRSDGLLRVDAPDDPDRTILSYKGMDVAFNSSTHQPDWAAWELTASETDGVEGRTNEFIQDNTVKGCPESREYSGSGYDRGHMAPAGDMKWNVTAMRQSFNMTNICPQSPDLNRGAWKKLEEKCREWAVRDGVLVIVCGPVIGYESAKNHSIGKTMRIPVPRAFFKAIIAPCAKPPRAIAFVMDNLGPVGDMRQAACSVDCVERMTGYDIFPALRDDLEAEVEAQCDFRAWERG